MYNYLEIENELQLKLEVKMEKELKILKNYLNENNLKLTTERQIVLNAVFSIHNHFDVEELYYHIKRKNQKKHVSRATIFRTLPLLIKSGLIKDALRCQGRNYYEHTFGHNHHDHLLCVKCGKIIEFEDQKIEKLQEKVCKKYGFYPIEHRLGIKGYCINCK